MDSNWLQWTQDNLQRRCDPEEICGILLKNKFSIAEIQQAMGMLFPANSALVKKLLPRSAMPALHNREPLVAIQRMLSRLDPNYRVIERRWELSRQEFLERYYAANRPVILCGIMGNWAATSRWAPEYLQAACGDETVEIMPGKPGNPLYEIDVGRDRLTVSLAKYFTMAADPANRYYMAARNDFFSRPAAQPLLRDIQLFPDYLEADFSGKGMALWFNPKDTVTPLQYERQNTLMAQLSGRRRFKLVPAGELDLVYHQSGPFSPVDPERPDDVRFPLFRNATVIDLELAPGEVLFVPVGWWHHTRALEQSIGMTLTRFVFPNSYSWTQDDAAIPAQPMAEASNAAPAVAFDPENPATYPVALPGVDYKALSEVRLTQPGVQSKLVRIDTPKVQLYALDGFMSAKECTALIKIINTNLRPSQVTLDNGDKYFRTSSSSTLSPEKHRLVATIEERIAATLGIRLPYSERIEAQKYETGQEFKAHTDFFEPRTQEYKEHALVMGNRTWTFMVYLNDTPKGGGTHFVKLDYTFFPKKGTAVIWNNLYPDGTPNRDTEHHGMPVEEGEKYIVTKWFREKGHGPLFYQDA